MIQNINIIRVLSLLIACGFSLSSLSAGRDNALMRQVASRQLHIADASQLDIISSSPSFTVYSHDGKGFAIVSTDVEQPQVLGYSFDGRYDATNENYRWWAEMMSEVLSDESRSYRKAVATPSALGFPQSVAPLMTVAWGQGYPYNALCPSSNGNHCLTGCVATAMAQILYTLQTPRHGFGHRTIYYPAHNKMGQPVSAIFADDYYDWDAMVDSYADTQTGETSRLAVATLMRDCGIAADMQYGVSSSGAAHINAAEGLRKYMGIETAEWKERMKCGQDEWMSMVYSELSQGRPILYGGMDPNPLSGISGHSFVLHGYDESGKVYVNWGWDGMSDGYYDIALLNPMNYQFSSTQDMVIGISRSEWMPMERSAALTDTPGGSLREQIAADELPLITSLTITGPLDDDDFAVIRQMASRGGRLENLDISNATLPEASLPACALQGCSELRHLTLPSDIVCWGDGALAGCSQVEINADDLMGDGDRQFFIEDNIVWNADHTELISLLPHTHSRLSVPRGTVALRPHALDGATGVNTIVLPSTITALGDNAVNGCWSLTELRVASKTVPAMGANVFSDIDLEQCTLYVPRGTMEDYLAAEGWMYFSISIAEYGTTIKARNAAREQYEENPEFGYTIQGDYVEGVPELVCEATPDSPVGRYPIHVYPGTIVDECVDYVDGYLIVTESTGISEHLADAAEQNVYTISGLHVDPSKEAAGRIPSGLYIKGRRKYIVKH